ncbi:MAG TPA: ABC transporter ATP-binding protein [Prevotella sp.]
MIKVENLSFSYKGMPEKMFDALNLEIVEGRIYGLLGKNGVGKTTLLYLLSGLLFPQDGTVKADNCEVRKRLPEVLGNIFLLPDEFNLPAVSIETFLQMKASFYPNFSREVFHRCLEAFEVEDTVALKSLSLGQKKKVLISFALATGVKYLLMDEPTNGLDIPSKSLFRKLVAANVADNQTVLISTHQVHDVETMLDSVLIMERNHRLLNTSVEAIARRFAFEYRSQADMTDEVIYSQPSLQGNAAIVRRSENMPETPVNIELFFNAVNKGMIKNEEVAP